MELRYWWEHGKVKITRVNQLNGERSLITLGLRVPIWKVGFCLRVFRPSEVRGWKERPQTAICCFERLQKLKRLATQLASSLPFHLRVTNIQPQSFLQCKCIQTLNFPHFFVQNIKKVFYFLYFYKSILLWIVHIQHSWKVPFVRSDWLVREWIASNIATCEQPKGKKSRIKNFRPFGNARKRGNTPSTLSAPVSEVRDVRDLTKLPSTYDLSRFATVCQIRTRPEDLLFMSSYANLSK